ncbi:MULTISPECIES: ClpXP protease specificity-enhancing factor [unclassified Acinetobacter]|uniref:ClpXP protease specificity-enhancing factor n=1 Tax=unclassified Acinetobacter TaxID=196816 RepID=UPI0029340EE0|nr:MULTISPECIES: ClpXP protease specificity-enhancing factor [unclassified Acinetobacter]WOE30378.1 ClpXP protease specificity-enhancing factor [Acinetobacter sp. SAAs470]WOE38569.1 ClpXP protease specificity-enhancing factor [Acinetobacter sp. SAAs474]
MSEQSLKLSPNRPYLARAIYDWICDNQLTPYIIVDATQPYISVPEQFIQDGQITLNIAPHAVNNFYMDKQAIAFAARFAGVSRDIYVPFKALIGIYARENGEGLFFNPDEYQDLDDTETEASSEQHHETTKKKPTLRLLD